MCWCFAKINGRLAEIYFDEDKKGINFLGHCYVKNVDYKTKREKRQIETDIMKHDFIYRNKKYKDRKTGMVFGMKKIYDYL